MKSQNDHIQTVIEYLLNINCSANSRDIRIISIKKMQIRKNMVDSF